MGVGARRVRVPAPARHGRDAATTSCRAEEHARCRIYAPVGAHEDLLAYLVRRLLENGANSSFVHQIVDEDVPAETVAADPIDRRSAGRAGFPPAPASSAPRGRTRAAGT